MPVLSVLRAGGGGETASSAQSQRDECGLHGTQGAQNCHPFASSELRHGRLFMSVSEELFRLLLPARRGVVFALVEGFALAFARVSWLDELD